MAITKPVVIRGVLLVAHPQQWAGKQVGGGCRGGWPAEGGTSQGPTMGHARPRGPYHAESSNNILNFQRVVESCSGIFKCAPKLCCHMLGCLCGLLHGS